MRWGNLKVMPSEVGEDEVGEYCAPLLLCLKLPVWPRGAAAGGLRVLYVSRQGHGPSSPPLAMKTPSPPVPS